MATNNVFYTPKNCTLIDQIDDNGLSICFQSDLEEMKRLHGEVYVITFGEFMTLKKQWSQENCITKPTEITKEKYNDMLEILPPENWRNIYELEYFQMCEYYMGNYTSYYSKYCGKFYTFRNQAWLKPDEVFKIIASAIN
jgi:hypothetical protein